MSLPWDDDEDALDGDGEADTSPHLPAVIAERDEAPLPLPGVTMQQVEKADEQGNVTETVFIPTIAVGSQRICDTCYVNATCPKFVENSRCAFGLPVRIQSREDLLAVAAMMVETQMDRVLFARYAESLEGGFANPKVSAEMDRFWSHVKTLRDISDNSEFMKITIEGRGKAGVMARLFGAQAAANLQQLPVGEFSETETDAVLSGILDAEVVEEEFDGRNPERNGHQHNGRRHGDVQPADPNERRR